MRVQQPIRRVDFMRDTLAPKGLAEHRTRTSPGTAAKIGRHN
jgi:hypothetical protein